MKTKIIPTQDHVLIRPLRDKTSQGGIVLPESAQSKVMRGQVVAVGPGKPNSVSEIVAPTTRIGDIAIYPAVGSPMIEIDHEGEKYLLMPETSIIALLE